MSSWLYLYGLTIAIFCRERARARSQDYDAFHIKDSHENVQRKPEDTEDREGKPIQRKKPEGTKVRISGEEEEPEKAVAGDSKKETVTSEEEAGPSGRVMSWFFSNTVIEEKPLTDAETSTKTLKESTAALQEDALQKNADYFLMEDAPFLDSRVHIKLKLINCH